MVKNFKTLHIWTRSRMFVKTIYLMTNKFPSNQQYRLTAQIERAIISVPSNIAEGCGRGTEKDLNRFLDISVASSCEVETQIYLAYDLGFISQEKMKNLSSEIAQIRRMIIGYQKTLKI